MARHLFPAASFSALTSAGLLLAACGPRDELKPVEAVPLVAPTAPLAVATAAAPKKAICDNDTPDAPVDCAALPKILGDCSAMTYYACPRQSRLPEGGGFRAGPAARMAQCFVKTNLGAIGDCVKPLEACVRSAVTASCARPEDIERCEKELPACGEEQKLLCAKLLSSMEPHLRDTALGALKELNGKRLARTCQITWDFPGFPFCPFCQFWQ